eukprot:gnl/Chilomastix_cuspidata/4446.p1 GENE.gnl/Chilomastix_cuspidata/4446~~gnl/Chilomastix_cuspidata/4446.p1  ORF type:complete len:531 (-),score=131.40 gnl/Chilomastix_cuspidata/4446:724-2316(-)
MMKMEYNPETPGKSQPGFVERPPLRNDGEYVGFGETHLFLLHERDKKAIAALQNARVAKMDKKFKKHCTFSPKINEKSRELTRTRKRLSPDEFFRRSVIQQRNHHARIAAQREYRAQNERAAALPRALPQSADLARRGRRRLEEKLGSSACVSERMDAFDRLFATAAARRRGEAVPATPRCASAAPSFGRLYEHGLQRRRARDELDLMLCKQRGGCARRTKAARRGSDDVFERLFSEHRAWVTNQSLREAERTCELTRPLPTSISLLSSWIADSSSRRRRRPACAAERRMQLTVAERSGECPAPPLPAECRQPIASKETIEAAFERVTRTPARAPRTPRAEESPPTPASARACSPQDHGAVFERQVEQMRLVRRRADDMRRALEARELDECSFSPRISPRASRIVKPRPPAPEPFDTPRRPSPELVFVARMKIAREERDRFRAAMSLMGSARDAEALHKTPRTAARAEATCAPVAALLPPASPADFSFHTNLRGARTPSPPRARAVEHSLALELGFDRRLLEQAARLKRG